MTDRIDLLKTKLAAREGKKEYTDSVREIKSEIARLETTSTAPVKGAE